MLKPGYVYHTGTGGKLTQDDVNDLTIALVPEDGFFRLNVLNEQASSDSVFIRVFSQIQLDEAGISSGKILKKTVPLFSAGTNEFFTSSASEAYLKIYWSFLIWIKVSSCSLVFPRCLYQYSGHLFERKRVKIDKKRSIR